MENEYYAIRWLDENTCARKTKEVELVCRISDGGKRIVISGEGDLEHHLIEDAAVFLKKICDEKCGKHSI